MCAGRGLRHSLEDRLEDVLQPTGVLLFCCCRCWPHLLPVSDEAVKQGVDSHAPPNRRLYRHPATRPQELPNLIRRGLVRHPNDAFAEVLDRRFHGRLDSAGFGLIPGIKGSVMPLAAPANRVAEVEAKDARRRGIQTRHR